jgi:hypothetical protein
MMYDLKKMNCDEYFEGRRSLYDGVVYYTAFFSVSPVQAKLYLVCPCKFHSENDFHFDSTFRLTCIHRQFFFTKSCKMF